MNRDGDYKHSVKGNTEFIVGKLTFGKLIFLSIVTLALSSFGPLSLFAPIPMAISFLLYGVKYTGSLSAIIMVAMVTASKLIPGADFLLSQASVYFVASVFGFFASRVIVKRQEPVKGLIQWSSALLLLIAGGVIVLSIASEFTLVNQIETFVTKSFEEALQRPEVKERLDAGGQEARALSSILNDPQMVVKTLLEWSFTAMFVGVFFSMWLTLYLVLRNVVIWKETHNYPYTLKDFVSFKAPDFMIYGLLAGMVMIVAGEYIHPLAEVIGFNITYSLGVFYFFQGFGVFMASLDWLGFRGFLRTALTVFTIFLGYKMIALVGVLDLFFDFETKLKKKSRSEGDIL